MEDKGRWTGRRITTDQAEALDFSPGDYGRMRDGRWLVKSPRGSGHLGDLSMHTVTEHEDGTITVSPSILVTDGRAPWHGYLERAVLREG